MTKYEPNFPEMPKQKLLEALGKPLEADKQELESQLSEKLIQKLDEDIPEGMTREEFVKAIEADRAVREQQMTHEELDPLQLFVSDLLYIKSTLELQKQTLNRFLRDQEMVHGHIIDLLVNVQKQLPIKP